jgi:DNA-directed RNA polymerase specialized sigma24 family protein
MSAVIERGYTDFNAVAPDQRDIDKRLANWGRWCNGGRAPATSPMFRMTPPPARVRADMGYEMADTIDSADAQIVAKAVAGLPQMYRKALSWHYVTPTSPARACKAMALSMSGLHRLVCDGRMMLRAELLTR